MLIGSPISCWFFCVAQRLNHLPAMQETWVQSLGRKIPWRRKWQPTPVFLPGESHGWRSLVGKVHRVAESRTRLSDFTFTLLLPERGTLKSLSVVVGLSTSCSVLSFYFTYFGAYILLSTYTFSNAVYLDELFVSWLEIFFFFLDNFPCSKVCFAWY